MSRCSKHVIRVTERNSQYTRSIYWATWAIPFSQANYRKIQNLSIDSLKENEKGESEKEKEKGETL